MPVIGREIDIVEFSVGNTHLIHINNAVGHAVGNPDLEQVILFQQG